MAENAITPEQLKGFNRPLEEKILEANADASKTLWKKVLPELMTAEIFTIAQLSEPDANGTKMMNVLQMTDKNGHSIIPFFTNPDKIRVLASKERNTFNVMKLNTAKFFHAIKGKPTVLNPGTKYSRVFSPFEMNILAAEYAPQPEKPAE